MALFPLRNLGGVGVIADQDPYSIPPNAFSMGVNVRFQNKKVLRGPVARQVGPMLKPADHVLSFKSELGPYRVHLVNTDGTITDWSPSVSEASPGDMTPPGWTPAINFGPVTSTQVNNVVYVNRPDHVPWYYVKGASGGYQELPSTTGTGWDSTWRCAVLRNLAGCLVALNVTKGADNFSTMVKWSDFTHYGGIPGTWAVDDTTASAGENTLAEMGEPIVDAQNLRNRLIIYGNHETWAMDFIGGNDIFQFSRIFEDAGAINANCVVSREGVHYVFGSEDLWMHDGVSKKSIADGRVKDFIFGSIIKTLSDRFFVVHNVAHNEIMFCYVSGDPYVYWPSSGTNVPDGCNRAAAYNYASDTWTFYDLPYVLAAGFATPAKLTTYDEALTDFVDWGGSYDRIDDETKVNLVITANPSESLGIQSALRTFEPSDYANAMGTLDPPANARALLVRNDLNLDQIAPNLQGYKLCSSLYPRGNLSAGSSPLRFLVGSADFADDTPSYSPEQTYGGTYYKLDHNIAGRYLSYQVISDDTHAFALSGIDFDVQLLGMR